MKDEEEESVQKKLLLKTSLNIALSYMKVRCAKDEQIVFKVVLQGLEKIVTVVNQFWWGCGKITGSYRCSCK